MVAHDGLQYQFGIQRRGEQEQEQQEEGEFDPA
jgi:hypothetical protein